MVFFASVLVVTDSSLSRLRLIVNSHPCLPEHLRAGTRNYHACAFEHIILLHLSANHPPEKALHATSPRPWRSLFRRFNRVSSALYVAKKANGIVASSEAESGICSIRPPPQHLIGCEYISIYSSRYKECFNIILRAVFDDFCCSRRMSRDSVRPCQDFQLVGPESRSAVAGVGSADTARVGPTCESRRKISYTEAILIM
jgi:hypothetical protein